MSFRCSECGSEEVINESFILVCSNCGNVVNDTPETYEQSTWTSTHNKKTNVHCDRYQVSCLNEHVETFCRDYTLRINPRISVCVRFGVDIIQNVCKLLNIAKSIQEMSIKLFKQVVTLREFKFDSSNIKQCLAISCLYLISNRENNPITLTELCKHTDCVFSHFGTVLFRLERTNPEIHPKKSKFIESLVPYYIFQLSLNEKERPMIEDYSTSLVWMWREVLLVQGFNPIYIIYAALYYGWKAVDPDRSKIRPKQFCSEVDIEFKNIIRCRIQFFYKVLEKFVQCCPLYDSDTLVTPDTISLRIKDIISTKRIVIYKFNELKQEIPKNGRKRASTVVYENCQRMDFSFLDVEDVELSDSEIDSYIRTDEEIKTIKTLQDN